MTQHPAELADRLRADGYCIVANALPRDLIAELNDMLDPRFATTPFCQGDFYGARTKRFGALLRRSHLAPELVRHRLIRDVAEALLLPHCQRIALNLTQAVEIHPGALAQIPHRDEDLYGGPKGVLEYQVNVIWPLTRFTAGNGATLVWPESNRGRTAAAAGPPIAAEMEPGSALMFLGSTLHGAGANLTDAVRRCVIVGYCLGWLKPFENQWLVYPPEIARRFDPEVAALAGYAQHLPNLGNVEGQCPSVLLHGVDLDNLAAVDALRQDQAEALRAYVAEQEAARAGLIGG